MTIFLWLLYMQIYKDLTMIWDFTHHSLKCKQFFCFVFLRSLDYSYCIFYGQSQITKTTRNKDSFLCSLGMSKGFNLKIFLNLFLKQSPAHLYLHLSDSKSGWDGKKCKNRIF